MSQNLISIKIRNREKILFQGEGKAVSSKNDKGVFDILPKHANFITLIKDRLLIHHPQGKDQEIPLKTGLLAVEKNQVKVYLDINTP